jgi:hypothetical protein
VAPPALPLPVKSTATAGTSKVSAPAVPATKAAPTAQYQQPIALPGAAEIAARNNPLPKSSPEDAAKPESMTSAPAEKEKSIKAAEAVRVDEGEEKKEEDKEEKEETTSATDKSKHEEHLSVPASALQSGTATPSEESEDAEEVKKPAAFRESFIKESSTSSSSTSIASLAERVQAMQVGEGKNVGEQEAGKAEDAVKSVED